MGYGLLVVCCWLSVTSLPMTRMIDHPKLGAWISIYILSAITHPSFNLILSYFLAGCVSPPPPQDVFSRVGCVVAQRNAPESDNSRDIQLPSDIVILFWSWKAKKLKPFHSNTSKLENITTYLGLLYLACLTEVVRCAKATTHPTDRVFW